jgi:hypothetical protein
MMFLKQKTFDVHIASLCFKQIIIELKFEYIESTLQYRFKTRVHYFNWVGQLFSFLANNDYATTYIVSILGGANRGKITQSFTNKGSNIKEEVKVK